MVLKTKLPIVKTRPVDCPMKKRNNPIKGKIPNKINTGRELNAFFLDWKDNVWKNYDLVFLIAQKHIGFFHARGEALDDM